ncbi:conserved hypothetical protein [Candidatus Nitrotoga fabula]|uniref:Terminase small subunit n=2 Tax=Candidatus Nitrotoga fabula TaxID=2182327 RepID=A0A916BEF1_9PROT|nr:conserved hypothetical protein [Candidatus Nitrotoga fabula]
MQVPSKSKMNVSKSEFARLLGVHKGTVTKWADAGRIEVINGRIDVQEAKRRLAATENPHPQAQAQIDRHATDKAMRMQAGSPVYSTPALEKIGTALKLETYRLQKAKAEIANLELDRAAGLLVERAEVEYVLAEFASTFRHLLESLADRLAPTIAVHRGDVAAIHAEIDMVSVALLNEMSEAMKRKMDGCTAS